MTENAATGTEPLWLSMEQEILELSSSDLEVDNKEPTIQRMRTSSTKRVTTFPVTAATCSS